MKKTFLFLALIICVFAFDGCERFKRVEVKREKVGNIELAYYTRGSGEPLLMIMGFRGTMAIWDPAFLEELEKKYTLILFDNRGIGLSTESESDILTIPLMAHDTAQLIKQLGYEKVHVLGWSMGSRIAMELALTFPDIVDTLILCSPNPGGKHQAIRKSNAYQKIVSVELPREEALALIFPDTTEGRQASMSYIDRMRNAIIKGTVPDDLKFKPKVVEQQVHALKLWEENNHVYESLSHLKIPTLVAGGLDDILDPPENIKIVADRVPFSWTAYFPGAGHNFLSQNYEHFSELVNVFIQSNKSTSE